MIRQWPFLIGGPLSLVAAIAAWRLHFSTSESITVVAAGGAIAWLAARVFTPSAAGVAAFGLFVSMPVVLSNAGALPIILVAAIVVWLAGIDAFERTGRPAWLAVSGAALGAGAAAGGQALVMMPVLAVCSVMVLMVVDTPPRVRAPAILALVAGVIVAAMPFTLYLMMHPQWIVDRAGAYSLYDTHRFNVFQGAREMVSWVGLTARSETYWHYFDPMFFLTRVVLLPAAILLPCGLAAVTATPMRRVRLLLFVGLLAAPLGGAVTLLPTDASRVTIAAPFAAWLMAAGLVALFERPRRWSQISGVLIAGWLIISAVTFALALR